MINPEAPVGLGSLCAYGHQVANFHLVVVLASVKQCRKMCIRYCCLSTSERNQSRGLVGRSLSPEGLIGPA